MKPRVFFQNVESSKGPEKPQDLKSTVQDGVNNVLPKVQEPGTRAEFQELMKKKWGSRVEQGQNNPEQAKKSPLYVINPNDGSIQLTRQPITPEEIKLQQAVNEARMNNNLEGALQLIRNANAQQNSPQQSDNNMRSPESPAMNIQPTGNGVNYSKPLPNIKPPVSTPLSENNNSLKDPRSIDPTKYFEIYGILNADSKGRELLKSKNTTAMPFTQMSSQEKRDYLIGVLQAVASTSDPSLKQKVKALGYRVTA